MEALEPFAGAVDKLFVREEGGWWATLSGSQALALALAPFDGAIEELLATVPPEVVE